MPKFSSQALRARQDIIIAIGTLICLMAVAMVFDLSDTWNNWAQEYEHWELDDVPIALALGSMAIGWYAYRRWQEGRREIQARMDTNRQLTIKIAEHKLAARKLQQSEQRFAGILDIATQAIISVGPDHCIQLFNKGAETIFGYRADEMLGKPLEILIPQRFRHSHHAHIEDFNRASHTSRLKGARANLFGLRKDGTEFPAAAAISKLVQDDDETIFTVMLQDVSARMRDEQELRTAKINAEAASIAKSNFLATMSHEIRTPMNCVLGMASVLLGTPLSEEQDRQVRVIKNSGEELMSLLNDILDLSKIEAGQVELEVLDFNLQDMLSSIKVLWQPQLQAKGLGFTINLATDIPPVLQGDPTRIRQILTNLISNAVKFTQTGGVTLEISQLPRISQDLELQFAVTDTGIGVEPEAQSRMFSKFTQADSSMTRKFGGTGLGLSICKHLTELMGGEIGFESVPGQGSTFWFLVPCKPGIDNATTRQIRTVNAGNNCAPMSNQTLRILIAEDNYANQVVLKAMLAPKNYQLDIVGNGIEAISSVKRVAYDLVLMDVRMPEMDGVVATQKIRDLPGETGKIPIIALTANAMDGDCEKFLEAGMTDYINKPIDKKKLFAVISKLTNPEPQECDGGTRLPDDGDTRALSGPQNLSFV